MDFPNDKTIPESAGRYYEGRKVFGGRFILKRKLGQGGMGQVWLALDVELGIDVALKFTSPELAGDTKAVADLRRAVTLGRELTHPGIVRVYDFHFDDRECAISMEYMPGKNLSECQAETVKGFFEPLEIHGVLTKVCEVLDYAHQVAKRSHRDIKPKNIMFDGETGTVKLADFDIGRRLTDTFSRNTGKEPSGSLPYMGPQQLLGQNSREQDDIYSLGATLYELLTGTPPFYQGDMREQIKHVIPSTMTQRRHDLLAEQSIACLGEAIPQVWENVVTACLSKEREQRPASGAKLLSLLNPADSPLVALSIPSAEPKSVIPVNRSSPANEPRRSLPTSDKVRFPFLWIITACSVLGFVAWGIVSFSKPADTRKVTDDVALPVVETSGGRNSPDWETTVPTFKVDTVTTKVTPSRWPQAASDIAPDAGATFGTLENGFRYIIYPNAEPPEHASLRLHIASGSLMEADDQQGLSHFLEHMVFNGSKDFTSDELVPKMQRLGIGFGAHVNAYTSFDETVYMLDLPDLSADTLKLGFTVMRDFGDGALLAAAEIDKERGVILSEKVSRDTVETRIMEQQFAKLLPDSLVAKRFPIGIEDVIKSAPRERFTDLYSRFYTPARMTFIVVGDIDAKEMQTRIEQTFSSMTNPADAGKNPDLGPIKQPEGIVASVFADKELSSTDVSLMLVRPYKVESDTAASRADDMTLDIAHSILTSRFERLSKIEGSAIASGSASNSNIFNYMEIGSIDVTASDDRWQEAVSIMEQEFRRALEYGFTEAELAEAKSNILNAHQQSVKQKATRKSESIASALAKSTNDNKVFSDPATDLELATKALASIDLKQVHDAFKAFWDASGYHLILTTKEKPENAEKDLAALYEKSRGKPVDAPAARALQPFGYTDFGRHGTVTSRKEVKDLGTTQLVLSNQVRVNLKPTDFEKGKIRLLARIGSGKLTQPKDSPMLDIFATAVFEGGGLGKHSNDDLQEILAGRNVGSSLAIGEDMFSIGGTTTPADFTTEVQLMCASLIDPGYRDEALWQFRKAIPMMYQQLKHTAAGPQQNMEAWLHGGDSRFIVAPVEKLSAYTIDDAKKWLAPELTKGYLELTIVGDFEIDKVLPDLLATFGAIPSRAANAPLLADARKVQFPNAPAVKTFTYDSKIPQGIAMALWKTDGIRNNQKETCRLNILASIYGDRLREEIREKLGASYSPNAGATGSDALDGFSYVIGESVGKPEDLELLLKTMRDLADTLSAKGATDDELDRALKPVLSQLAKSTRDNSYWLGTVLSQSQADPQRLDFARGRDTDYKSISLNEVNALAKKYLSAQNALLVSIKPSK